MNCSLSRYRRRRPVGRPTGFTLIEVLLVLVILVILGSIAVPMFQKIRERALINAAKAQVQLFESAVDLYAATTNQSPSGLGDLIDRPSDQKVARVWNGPYLKENRNLTDPWEDPYEYLAKGIANSTANKPNSVVNLMIGLSATEDVSLNGSPTVSPTTVAACSGVFFSRKVHFHDFFGVVPCAAGVGHENGLVQAEDRDRDQIADEEELAARRQKRA